LTTLLLQRCPNDQSLQKNHVLQAITYQQRDYSERPNASSLGFLGSSGHFRYPISESSKPDSECFEEAGRTTLTTLAYGKSGRTSPKVLSITLTEINNF
jgi:hypothetical protein